MTDSITLQIEGLAQLKLDMALAAAKIQGEVMQSAANGGAQEILKMARNNLPASHKTLKRSLVKKKIPTRRKHYIKYTIGPTTGKNAKFDGWYAHIVENGAKEHELSPKTKKALKFGEVIVKRVPRHPGVRATKFMARAFNQHDRILNAIVRAGRRRFNLMKSRGKI